MIKVSPYFSTASRVCAAELPLDDHCAAGIQCRRNAAGVESATVKPRGGVHGDIGKGKGEMNHHIVGRKHLIDAGEADALLSARCAGGEKPQSLIVNGEFPGERRSSVGQSATKPV